ncbi:hypothetical protein AMS68_000426 [Peltaster fructicola]|uniref:Haloacid dehalogenase, type II n=1 Tax=Peltaster fructicola TaxID=286661 RepID=A0A6H0XJU3_9PEZI|nr:hypothetical protein AMS68_000426 [Peltaster fructicola]
MSSLRDVRGLLFDVFGTCVDWRTTVTEALQSAAHKSVSYRERSPSEAVRARAAEMTDSGWGDFAQQWRTSYLKFTRALAANSSTEYKTVDQHHLDSLYDLLEAHGLLEPSEESRAGPGSLWNDTQIKEMSLIWHRLNPWPDTCNGIRELNKHYQTSTLTNGNLSLITDMVAYGKMEFTHVLSAEMFHSYKPNPAVYLGGAAKLGLEPSQCAMVAAHLDDLMYAQQCGFRTIYVERLNEENHPELREQEGLVDIWVREGEPGFEKVAERLQSL